MPPKASHTVIRAALEECVDGVWCPVESGLGTSRLTLRVYHVPIPRRDFSELLTSTSTAMPAVSSEIEELIAAHRDHVYMTYHNLEDLILLMYGQDISCGLIDEIIALRATNPRRLIVYKATVKAS